MLKTYISTLPVLLCGECGQSTYSGYLSYIRVFTVAVGVDLVLALTEVLTLVWSSGEKAAAAKVIFSGNYGFLFIWIYLIVGLAVPLVVLARKRESRGVQVVAAVLVLVGTLAMRYVIVMGGRALPLS